MTKAELERRVRELEQQVTSLRIQLSMLRAFVPHPTVVPVPMPIVWPPHFIQC